MKQISIQITDETARQIARLAKRWGLPPERHNTPVIERAIATLFMLEIGHDEYTQRLKQIKEDGDQGGCNGQVNGDIRQAASAAHPQP